MFLWKLIISRGLLHAACITSCIYNSMRYKFKCNCFVLDIGKYSYDTMI